MDEFDRLATMAKPRPRSLPLAPLAPKALRLPLAEPRADDRRYRPVYVVWELTLKCDLACRHCGSRAGRARPEELTTAECLDLVDQLAELGALEVTLIGGEAYLRDDWVEIARAIVTHGMKCTMTTGGRGVTPRIARAAAAAGIRRVGVSVDGLKATHDRLRGVDGSFGAALGALHHLKQAGISISANTQLNRLSMPELPELLEALIAQGIRAWQVQLTVPMGRAADEPDVLFQPHDLLELFPLLARLKKRCDAAKVLFWPANNVGYFGPYEREFRGLTRTGHMSSCSAGRASLGIEADGTIKGCPSLPTQSYSGGSVRHERLRSIWERAAPLRFMRDRTVEDLWGYCRSCYYSKTCLGGCNWTSHVILGRAGNNPYCHHRALEMNRLGKRERLVPVDSAPGAPFDHGTFRVVVEDDPRSY
jgi:radical SAM protein with 4Fe4S-binding SPASM domain